MNLYIQQKLFSFRDRFAVQDENQNPVYYVEAEAFTWGKKLHIYDTSGREVCFIAQEFTFFHYAFRIEAAGRQPVTIVQRFSFMVPRYSVPELGWEIAGEFMAHEYRFTSPAGEIAVLSKEWFTWGDTYHLTVHNAADGLLALAAVIVIDVINEQQRN